MMPLMNSSETLQARYEAAYRAIQDADAKGRSQRTVNKLWKAFFKVEDEAKAAGAL
jgi:hypothetical protein